MITKMQRKVLTFVYWQNVAGVLVTGQSVADHFGMRSRYHASHYLRRLRARGLLHNTARCTGWSVTHEGCQLVPRVKIDKGTALALGKQVEHD